nr:hypothetical protein CFP56_21705 [Quercus suber]
MPLRYRFKSTAVSVVSSSVFIWTYAAVHLLITVRVPPMDDGDRMLPRSHLQARTASNPAIIALLTSSASSHASADRSRRLQCIFQVRRETARCINTPISKLFDLKRLADRADLFHPLCSLLGCYTNT